MKKKLNIFNSAFGIRANLKSKELKIQKYWQKINLIETINYNKKEKFYLHIGPPYANGDIHIGHALNFILKDIVLRFQNLNQKAITAIPGWDTHGLPIALMVTQKSKTNPSTNTIAFREKCAAFTKAQIIKQITQLERLGTQINFKKKYLTLKPTYVSQQLHIFAKMIEQNLIFRSHKPIYWSWSSKTALADTEVEYLTKKSTSIFILFPILFNTKLPKNSAFLVWTTAPWTIPTNQFLAINQKAKYAVITSKNTKHKTIILAAKIWEKFHEEWKWLQQAKLIKFVEGKELINCQYQHPYLNFSSKVIHSNHVNLEEGSGVVHIAPAHGLEDFYLVQNIHQIICTINDQGFFNEQTVDQDLKGIFYMDSEKIIIKKIEKKGNLLFQQEIQHQYPHDWRTKKPVIYLLTAQWYLNLQPLKKEIKSLVEQTEWIPTWGKKRMRKILEAREDWCLSRQRSWGVPVPIFFNKAKKAILDVNLVKHVANLITQNGDNIWWNWKISQLLTKEQINKHEIISKSTDTFDVWFDSGCSAQIVHAKDTINLIWEGNDQYRGWFNSLIIIAALNQKLKIKKILTHGFVNDALGKKMSKSVGNVVKPLEICQAYGADILRLWVASSNYFEDLNLDMKLIENVAKNYIKIRNTMRFLINNLVDFQKQANEKTALREIDYWILIKTNTLIQKVTKYFHEFQFHLAYQLLNNFAINDLSGMYFDYAKQILYPQHFDAYARRQIQTVFFHLWKNLLLLWTPFLPHTSEEGYQTITPEPKQQSIHLSHWPSEIQLPLTLKEQTNILLQWHFLEEVRKEIHKLLENALKTQKIKSFKITTVFINYDKNYQLFTNQINCQLFCEEFLFKAQKNYQALNQDFLNNIKTIENIVDLHFFFKVQKIIFSNSKQGKQTKIGNLWFVHHDGLLCQHCNWKIAADQKDYCDQCQKNN